MIARNVSVSVLSRQDICKSIMPAPSYIQFLISAIAARIVFSLTTPARTGDGNCDILCIMLPPILILKFTISNVHSYVNVTFDFFIIFDTRNLLILEGRIAIIL